MNVNLPDRKRLKIAIVIDAYDDCKNGAVISTQRFVSLLRKEHDVIVITTGEPAPGKTLLPGFYPPFVKKVMKRMRTPMAYPVKSKLRKVFREVDLVHIQFPFLLALRSVAIARKMNLPVVSTFHIQAEHLAMNAGIHSKRFVDTCYKVWMKRLYNLSDLVICPSKFAEDELKRYGLKSPSVIISNGILPVYHPTKKQREEKFNGKFIVLSVGRFSPEKKHQMIIRAIDQSKHRENIQLILIGEGPIREKLEKEGESLPAKPVFLALPAEELIYYYNIADLYIHAANIEIEGMTILEAMGCGLPVLVADSPKSAARQFALDNSFLFDSTDITDLVSKLDYWIENPGKLRESREKYLSTSRNFRIETSYEKLVEQYSRLINHNGI
jgi:1,2-diacylglycerol 3-alpha-glucosyltransferase